MNNDVTQMSDEPVDGGGDGLLCHLNKKLFLDMTKACIDLCFCLN